jgi:hypothetical protein
MPKNLTYDEIIYKVITSLHELKSYTKTHEPTQTEKVDLVINDVMDVDYFMAYGRERLTDES